MDKIIKVTWRDHDGSANFRIFEDSHPPRTASLKKEGYMDYQELIDNATSSADLKDKVTMTLRGYGFPTNVSWDDLLYNFKQFTPFLEQAIEKWESLMEIEDTKQASMEKREPVSIKFYDEASEIGSHQLEAMAEEVLSSWYDMQTPGGIAIYKLNTQFMKHNIPEAELIIEAIEGLTKCVKKAVNRADRVNIIHTIGNLELLAAEAADYESDED